jgi:TM2 domain-containing membrane protein YozV
MTVTPLPEPISPKSRTATLLLGIFTGFVGGHRFFAGKTATGVLMACTLGGLGLWWLADLIVIGTGEFTDSKGRRIVNWSPDEDRLSGRLGAGPRIAEEMEELRGEVYDLQERVDFLERTLAQVRERPGLGPGSRS